MSQIKYYFENLPKTNKDYYLQIVNNRTLTSVYHSHDFYELIIFLKGSSVHYVNGETYQIKSGQMVCLFPNDFHKFISQSEDTYAISLSVNVSEFISIADIFGFSLGNLPHIKPIDFFDSSNTIYNQSISCLSTYKNNDYKLLLCHLFNDMTYTINSGNDALLNDTFKLMQHPENMKDGIKAMMRISGYSRSQLYRLVKSYTGLTVNEYLMELRLKTAYQYILYTDNTFEQIGEDVGYKSFSHFCKIFKEKFSVTPAQLRKTRPINTI